MQEFFHFVVGDFVFRGEREHYLVSLLALAVLGGDAGASEEIADGVCWGWCTGRRGRRLGSQLVLSGVEGLTFWGQRLIGRYLSRWG